MNAYTPRHLRRGRSGKGGVKEQAKQKSFRKCKLLSDRFIHQSSSSLEHPSLNQAYLDYCARCDRDGLRKG